MRAIVLCFVFRVLWAQPVDWYTRPLYPLSTASLTRAELAPILEAACAGKSYWREGKMGCRVWPVGRRDLTPELGMEVNGVLLGHFLSPRSEDAVLSTRGCEAHSQNCGGSIVLTRRDGKWISLGYRSGVITDQCHSLRTGSGLEFLLCSLSDAGQGVHGRTLSIFDFRRDARPRVLASVGVNNSMRGCGQAGEGKRDEVIQSVIDSVAFPDLDGDGIADVAIVARSGKTRRTDAEFASCEQWSAGKLVWTPRVRLPAYRVEFLVGWDGVTLTPRSRRSAAVFR